MISGLKNLVKTIYVISIVYGIAIVVLGVVLFINPDSGRSSKDELIPTYDYHPYLEPGSYARMQVTDAQLLTREFEIYRNAFYDDDELSLYHGGMYLRSYFLCSDRKGNSAVVAQEEFKVIPKDEKSLSVLNRLELQQIYQWDLDFLEEVKAAGSSGVEIYFHVGNTTAMKGRKDSVWYRWTKHELTELPDTIHGYLNELLVEDPKSDVDFTNAVELAGQYRYGELVTETPEMKYKKENSQTKGISLIMALIGALYLGLVWKIRQYRKKKQAAPARSGQPVLSERELREKHQKTVEQLNQQEEEARRSEAKALHQKQEQQKKTAGTASSPVQISSPQKPPARDNAPVKNPVQKEPVSKTKQLVKIIEQQEEEARRLEEEAAQRESERRKKQRPGAGIASQTIERIINKARAMNPVDQELVHQQGQIQLLDAVRKVIPILDILAEEGHSAVYLYEKKITSGQQMLTVLNHILLEMEELLNHEQDNLDEIFRQSSSYPISDLYMAVKAMDFYNELAGESENIYMSLLFLIDEIIDKEEKE